MTQHPTPSRNRTGRWLVLAAFGVALAALYHFDVHHLLRYQTLHDHHASLSAWVGRNHAVALVGFMALYIGTVAFSLPGAVWLTLAGGFLFGTVTAALVVVVAATLGATVVFLLARYVFADLWRSKAGSTLARMEEGFRANAFSYLLVLRLVPLFPFWLVNLAPALLGVRLRTFVAATFIGIIPGTVVFSSIGGGLDEVLSRGEQPDLSLLFSPHILGPLLGLAALSLLPIPLKRWWHRSQKP